MSKFLNNIMGRSNLTDEEMAAVVDQQISMMEENQESQPQKTKDPNIPPFLRDKLASISLSVNKEGSLDVTVYWDEDNEDCSNSMGHLIYRLNNGELKESIHDAFNTIGREDVSRMPFLRRFASKYKELEDENPLLTPSKVFELSNMPRNKE